MKVTYLTHPINESTPSYGNRDRISLKPNNQISEGDTANTTEIHITNNHIGTHFDVPKHFYDDGKTITDIDPLEWVFDNVKLVDIECEKGRLIDIEDFEGFEIPHETDLLLIRTGFEKLRDSDLYWNAYPGISEKACEYLREAYPKLRAVGFDFISLTSPLFKLEGKAAHRALLDERKGSIVLIIEDMKIGHLNEDPKKIIMAPLLLDNGNGGPVTVLAF